MKEFILFSILFWVSAVMNLNGLHVISACLLMGTGILLYFLYCRKLDSFLAPPAVFSLSWIFCIGIACLQLSSLQTDWEIKTFIVFYLIYSAFVLCFLLFFQKTEDSAFFETISQKAESFFLITKPQLFAVICIYTGISFVSFLLEAVILGFVPLFTEGTPHAYSTFHVSGLHYFTVLFVLVPSLCVLYLQKVRKGRARIAVCFCLMISLMLPLLLVSRFQLIFSVGLAALTFLIQNQRNIRRYINFRTVLLAAASVLLLLSAYVFITVERAHSIEYLNGIFEMKDPDIPIYISQPYIYIANNFENFNCLIRGLEAYSCGLKMAFPFFALTGLKFVFPELLSFPLYITKEELTTVTMFYDAYYDFGIPGILGFAILTGLLFSFLFRLTGSCSRELLLVIYAQLLMYLFLAFFTTWFSNPTTWFYLGAVLVTALILWYINCKRMEKG